MKKVVLITGASAGMGKETARLLLEQGYIVYGAARRVEKMAPLQALGLNVLFMDVADDTSMRNGIDSIIRAEGRIDILINNAGFGSYGALEDVTMEEANYQLQVNLFAPARLIQLVLPYMRHQRAGTIVNISSTGGKAAMPLGGWYHASKFALEAYSDSLRMEVKEFGIDVVVIEPGGIQTEWADIAMSHLAKKSAGSAYHSLITGAQRMTQRMSKKTLPPPAIIARLIAKVLQTRKPRTRYVKGYMASVVLFMKRWLSDKMFDRMTLSQLK
jgi:NAD(P)-dependent dehydrogenase (short-subunit alcohol dehydrogenase family)